MNNKPRIETTKNGALQRVFFHYHKAESDKAGEPRLTVHFKDTCNLVAFVKSFVPLESETKKVYKINEN